MFHNINYGQTLCRVLILMFYSLHCGAIHKLRHAILADFLPPLPLYNFWLALLQLEISPQLSFLCQTSHQCW